MYKVEGILREKFAPDGSFLRLQSAFTYYLHTVGGVTAFLEEQKPFIACAITNMMTQKDETSDFITV